MFSSLRYILLILASLFFSILSCEEAKVELPLEFQQFKAYMGTKPQDLSRLRPDFLFEFGRHGHTLDALDLEAKKQEILSLKEQYKTISALPNLEDSLLQIQREAQLWIIERKIEEEPFFFYENPINPITGFHVRLLKTFHDQYIATKEETEAYNARMKMVPKQINEVISLLKARHEAGIESPRFLLEASKTQLEDFLALETSQNPLYRGLAIKLNQVDPTSLNLYQASDYLEVAEINLRTFIQPAYKKLIAIIDELLLEVSAEGSELPKMDSYYAHQLHKYCGKQVNPEKVFEEGQKALDSIQQLIQTLEQNLPISTSKAETEQSRRTNRLEQVQLFAAQMRNTRAQMIGLFDSLPQKSPEIMAKPSYLQQKSLLVYEPASLDLVRKARVIVDFDKWKKASTYKKKALLCTQIYPGSFTLDHHSHKVASYISPDGFLGWHKGWQNYALRLADQPLYLFSGEKELKLQFLQGQAQLAIQMLLDIGVHHRNWSSKQANDFLKKQAPKLSEDSAQILLQAYSNPGALVAPWIGAQEFQRLANYTKVRFDGKITIKGFHDISTKNGPLPWFLFQKSIDLYDSRNMAR